jgi:ribose 5-phosphate isomerase B
MSAMPPPEHEVRALVAAILAEIAGESVQPAAPEGERPAPRVSAEIAVGADHGGYRLKERIVADLRERGLEVHDCGTNSTDAVDYPDFAHAVARLVADGACRWGIVVDGAGIGSCMAANKVPGVRAATCWDLSSARNSREHNHANVLVLGAGLVGEGLALQIVDAWLATPWGGERHARRVEKITEIERRYLSPERVAA